jgi:outer membrane PBP1 activator LpoA protein
MEKRSLTLPLLALAILALILSGCAVTPPAGQPAAADSELLQKAEAAAARGDLETASRYYLRLAEQGSTLKRPEYRLQAASLLLQGNHVEQATRLIRQIDPATLHELQQVRRQLLLARIALINHRTGDALQALDISQPSTMPDSQRAELYRLRAEAYSRRNDVVKAAQNYIIAGSYIQDPEQRLAVQRHIWQLLAQLPPETLDKLGKSAAGPPDEFSGWLALMRIARDSREQPIDVSARLQQWRSAYPNHRADQSILDALLARQEKVARHPSRVALLLPLTGPYQKPAAVIRDGIMAAYYNYPDEAKTTTSIRVYDTTGFDSIDEAYKQAVADGAGFVVGPLIKDNVADLGNSRRLPVPVLTLNYADRGNTPSGFYQFGLSPEQEAQQVAERAWLDGNNRALVMTPDSPWGERVARAFSEHWQKLGGILLKQEAYPDDKNDFSVQIQSLLELDLSKDRARKLRAVLHSDLRFEPRRRQDADYVFLAAFPRQARLIRPQLKFHYASGLPIYSTSHVFSGIRSRYKDRDMDDIEFCDTPWTLEQNPSPLKRRLTRLWPEQSRDYSRFFALGIDAYELIPQLDYLHMFRHERFNGVTGILSLNEDRRVFRTLEWARFDKGLPTLLQ